MHACRLFNNTVLSLLGLMPFYTQYHNIKLMQLLRAQPINMPSSNKISMKNALKSLLKNVVLSRKHLSKIGRTKFSFGQPCNRGRRQSDGNFFFLKIGFSSIKDLVRRENR
jgi:hypothetical protein